ncbi:O-linked N-acetylglucosamine transferase family protein [Vacuolonema iberomarrocanum]|uniref:O-linked N-acetylglucosamine transferase, SPINDLY family protein n=1 Tax=Vacuolonema iberomarrocanum TaxID=3454632 RepID=UPI001A109575|nr:O-linked N-acetylglucosamine transferase, SPINDLY family protein [filamentous cyanobacterium LEGE 07170]
MELSGSSSTEAAQPSQWEQEGDRQLAQGEFEQAAAIFEQWAEAKPETLRARWLLGVAYLLLGQEEAAQLTWTMAIAEADDTDALHVEKALGELVDILQAEARRQTAGDQWERVWLLRRHLSELTPDDPQNALLGIQSAMQAGYLTPDAFPDWGLTAEWAELELPAELFPLLEDTVRRVMQWDGATPEPLAWLEAVLPKLPNPNAVAQWLFDRCIQLQVKLGAPQPAIRYAELCLHHFPNHTPIKERLVWLYQDTRRYGEGLALAQELLADCQTAYQRLMRNSLRLRGLMMMSDRWQESLHALAENTQLIEQELAEFQPDPNGIVEAKLMCLPTFFYPYTSDNPEQTRSLQNRLAQLYVENTHAMVAQHFPDYRPFQPDDAIPWNHDKLRIGFLSRCLRRHSIGWLSRWIFQHFDRDRFEFHVYFNQITQLPDFSQQWFVAPATSAQIMEGGFINMAQKIRHDEIDILVDLDSITADSGCAILALKPAPVQVTWLGMDASGLPTIDYFLVDSHVVSDAADEQYAETLWRLPQTYIAVDGFEIGVPTLRRDELGIPADAIIYFSAQTAAKRHPDTTRLQMQILKQVPNSYFLLKGLGDAKGMQSFFRTIAEEEGVEGDRLFFLDRDQNEPTHRANLDIADVVLDTFPYNGATTTLETLWLGIPLVTQVGQQFASRNSYTLLRNAGIHTEGIAHSSEEYVEWGVRYGKDRALRQAIRTRLQRSRQTASLWNAQQFTRNLEAAFTQMWEHRLTGR